MLEKALKVYITEDSIQDVFYEVEWSHEMQTFLFKIELELKFPK